MSEYREFLNGISAVHPLTPEAHRHLGDLFAEDGAGRRASFEAGASSSTAVYSERAVKILPGQNESPPQKTNGSNEATTTGTSKEQEETIEDGKEPTSSDSTAATSQNDAAEEPEAAHDSESPETEDMPVRASTEKTPNSNDEAEEETAREDLGQHGTDQGHGESEEHHAAIMAEIPHEGSSGLEKPNEGQDGDDQATLIIADAKANGPEKQDEPSADFDVTDIRFRPDEMPGMPHNEKDSHPATEHLLDDNQEQNSSLGEGEGVSSAESEGEQVPRQIAMALDTSFLDDFMPQEGAKVDLATVDQEGTDTEGLKLPDTDENAHRNTGDDGQNNLQDTETEEGNLDPKDSTKAESMADEKNREEGTESADSASPGPSETNDADDEIAPAPYSATATGVYQDAGGPTDNSGFLPHDIDKNTAPEDEIPYVGDKMSDATAETATNAVSEDTPNLHDAGKRAEGESDADDADRQPEGASALNEWAEPVDNLPGAPPKEGRAAADEGLGTERIEDTSWEGSEHPSGEHNDESHEDGTETKEKGAMLKWIGIAVAAGVVAAGGGYVLVPYIDIGQPKPEDRSDPLELLALDQRSPTQEEGIGTPLPEAQPPALPAAHNLAIPAQEDQAASDIPHITERGSSGPLQSVPEPPSAVENLEADDFALAAPSEEGGSQQAEKFVSRLTKHMESMEKEISSDVESLAQTVDGIVSDMAAISDRQALILDSLDGITEAIDLVQSNNDPTRASREDTSLVSQADPSQPEQEQNQKPPVTSSEPKEKIAYSPWDEYQFIGMAREFEDGLFILHSKSGRPFVHRPSDEVFDGREDMVITSVFPEGILFDDGRYIGSLPAQLPPDKAAQQQQAAPSRRMLPEWQYLGTAGQTEANEKKTIHIFQSPRAEVVMVDEGKALEEHGIVGGIGPNGRMLIGEEYFLHTPEALASQEFAH